MEKYHSFEKVMSGRFNFHILLLMLSLWAVQSDFLFADTNPGKPGKSHEVYLANTDHELHVYRIRGREPGKTILIIGGIHGNEPGGYLAADKYVDISLSRGNLIVVPRANLDSILVNHRGRNGDYNRKFDVELKRDNSDDQVIAVLKSLIDESDLVLNLHDGSGFYREKWLDDKHNPFRYGQSIIADCELFNPLGESHTLKLGEIARRIVSRVNAKIPEEAYHFRFANHNSISPDTNYPEMRKTATYYALTKHHIPAFGIETSKELPSTDMKVAYQVMAVNAFLAEFDVLIDAPGDQVETPKLDYVVVSLNGSNEVVVKDGGTLHVENGDSVRIEHIVGNYDRYMFADFVGVGGRNDNGLTVEIKKTTHVNIRKDAFVCGSFSIIPDNHDQEPLAKIHGSKSEGFLIDVNGSIELVPGGNEMTIVIGDRLRIVDYISRDDIKGINVNFVGFVGNPKDNRGEDRGYVIRTGSDLMPDWSLDGHGERYKIAARRGQEEVSSINVRLITAELDYVVLQPNDEEPIVVKNGAEIQLSTGDSFNILGVRSNAPDEKWMTWQLLDNSGDVQEMDGTRFSTTKETSPEWVQLSVFRGQMPLGKVVIRFLESDNSIRTKQR